MKKNKHVQREEETLKFWQEKEIFKKSVEKTAPEGEYAFYDGPPFATGLPHYGHILSSVIKDVVPRYWTMKGYHVRRRWGWDCHGLPIENIVEKELEVSGKKDIENKVGIEKFNKTCESKVLKYTNDWKKMVARIGRWIEFDNAYKTMDSTYMESVWWALKTIWEKELIYEGRKVLMYCPRCETPVSKAEVAMDNSYKEITEESLTAKFKIKNPEKHDLPENSYFLAWTTTPWTLPGNVALAVGEDIDYALVEKEGEHLILAKKFAQDLKVEKTFKGKDLVDIEYAPLFDIKAIHETGKKAWYVTLADFVTTEEGTGIVHTAVVYGEDDYLLGQKIDLPVVPLLDEKGHFNKLAPELIEGKYFKGAEKEIKADLEKRGLVFAREQYTHSYPHCWRCDTQLFYNAISAWFINVQKVKKKLISENENINWFPKHLKHGRFLNILETAPDWNISRNRFWATPLPFWKCKNDACANQECIGSVEELKEKAVNFNEVYDTDKVEDMDLHKHKMDQVKLKCKCGGEMKRIPEVIDCWVESGSMPFAEFHYPFENEKVFKARYPGQYIAEYIAQTRAWFYYMHVMAVLLFDKASYENCVTTGTILNDKGEKLSKSKQNFTDPWEIINEYGVDALRYYLMTSVVMQAENLLFNDREVRDVYNKVINILSNVTTFYQMHADKADPKAKAAQSKNILDRWILARLNQLVQTTTTKMDNYNTIKAGRPIKDFIDDLSTWYVRRSRQRFKDGDQEALATLKEVLLTLSKVMAPFTPFIAENIYQEISKEKESVHLEEWPKVDKKLIDEELIGQMVKVREHVEKGLALREEAQIKVRQPLNKFQVSGLGLAEDLLVLIADEINVKAVSEGKDYKLDTKLNKELKEEGLVRELIRSVNALRKKQGLTIKDKVEVNFQTEDQELVKVIENNHDELCKGTSSKSFIASTGTEEVKINEKVLHLTLNKV